jgi:1-aminocyclopropane-1-carboxylate deaminase
MPDQIAYSATPFQELEYPSLARSGVRIVVKREDLNHPHVSGNKWWKLKYNLQEAKRSGHHTLLTFGGAFSNHLYATAAAARELGFRSIGVVRGEETLPLNPTLAFARECGMHLHYVDRTKYREKDSDHFNLDLKRRFGDFYRIPEGGTNEHAIRGVAEFARAVKQQLHFDYLCLPVGTGGTLAGVIAGLAGDAEVIGVSVLKDGLFLQRQVENGLREFSGSLFTNWRIETSYHQGGYAKTTPALLAFIEAMKHQHNLPLDRVYTGKLLVAVIDMIRQEKFKPGSTVLVLHTGGLQGVY